MVTLAARVIRYVRGGKVLVVMAVLAPALLTLAMGSLALLRPAVPPAVPSPSVTATQTAFVAPTPIAHGKNATPVGGGQKPHHKTGDPHGIH